MGSWLTYVSHCMCKHNQTTAFSEIWLGEEKAASVEYWRGDITKWDIEKLRMHDNGNGIVLKNKVRPSVCLMRMYVCVLYNTIRVS